MTGDLFSNCKFNDLFSDSVVCPWRLFKALLYFILISLLNTLDQAAPLLALCARSHSGNQAFDFDLTSTLWVKMGLTALWDKNGGEGGAVVCETSAAQQSLPLSAD